MVLIFSKIKLFKKIYNRITFVDELKDHVMLMKFAMVLDHLVLLINFKT